MVRSNIWKFYAFRFLRSFMMIMPIIVPFFKSNGLTMFHILTIQAVFSLTAVFLEIPSGFFADVFGRKKSMVFAAITGTIGMLIYSLSSSFWAFIFAEVILAIGFAFFSGTGSALAYDSLLELGEDYRYKKVEGTSFFLGRCAEATASILGGLFAVISLRLPFYLTAAVFALLIPLSLTIKEPKRKPFKHKKGHMYGLYKILRFSLHKNKELKWLIIYGAFIANSTLIAVWFFQPYFEQVGIPLVYFGVLWAVIQLSSGFSAYFAYKIESIIGRKISLASLLLITSLGYILLGSSNHLWGLIFCFMFTLIWGFSNPLLQDYINKIVWSDKRATVMSVKNLLSRLIFVIFAPLIGWLADTYTIQITMIGCGFSFFILWILSMIFLKKNKVF